MSYWDIAVMAADTELLRRVTACAAQEEVEGDPYTWAADHILLLAAEPGWAEAWAYAIAAGNETPGRDPGVISDGMILSAVQGMVISNLPASQPQNGE